MAELTRRPARLGLPVLLLLAIIVTVAVFYLAPDIDLEVAGWFYRGQNRFLGQTAAGELTRKLLYWIPTLVFVAFVGLYGLRRLGRNDWWAPSGRGVIALALSFSIGPGLLVNTILKDHSHRPRPYQTLNFGGDDAFRPFYTFDGDCARNCSFVSGEGAASTWTIAPALLAPLPLRAVAVSAAIVYALIASLLRMAFGGHYLSDTIFAALFTLAVIGATWRVIRPDELEVRGNPRRKPAPPRR